MGTNTAFECVVMGCTVVIALLVKDLVSRVLWGGGAPDLMRRRGMTCAEPFPISYSSSREKAKISTESPTPGRTAVTRVVWYVRKVWFPKNKTQLSRRGRSWSWMRSCCWMM